MNTTVLACCVGVSMALAAQLAQAQQDVCSFFATQAATVAGLAQAKDEAMKSGANVICRRWSGDRRVQLDLIVEPPASARGLAMRRMLAMNAKEPGMKVQDEPALGADAFSFATKEQASFSFAGRSGSYTLTLNREPGIAPADVDRLREIAKQIAGR